jgi:hypothetical protein
VCPEAHFIAGTNAFFYETARAEVNFPGKVLEIVTHAPFSMDYRILLWICGCNLLQECADGFMDYLHVPISLQIIVLLFTTGLALNYPLKRDFQENLL